jgi:hypothetical protein
MKFAILSTTITTLLLATLTSTSPTPEVQELHPKKFTPPESMIYTGFAGINFHVSDTEVFQLNTRFHYHYELPKSVYHTKSISIHYGETTLATEVECLVSKKKKMKGDVWKINGTFPNWAFPEGSEMKSIQCTPMRVVTIYDKPRCVGRYLTTLPECGAIA